MRLISGPQRRPELNLQHLAASSLHVEPRKTGAECRDPPTFAKLILPSLPSASLTGLPASYAFEVPERSMFKEDYFFPGTFGKLTPLHLPKWLPLSHERIVTSLTLDYEDRKSQILASQNFAARCGGSEVEVDVVPDLRDSRSIHSHPLQEQLPES